MDAAKKKAIQGYVDEVARYEQQKKDIGESIKEICTVATEKYQISPKVIKQLAKEQNMDAVEREERRLVEEQLDECRSALGMLLDTPLGEAATKKIEKSKQSKTERKRGRMKDQPEARA